MTGSAILEQSADAHVDCDELDPLLEDPNFEMNNLDDLLNSQVNEGPPEELIEVNEVNAAPLNPHELEPEIQMMTGSAILEQSVDAHVVGSTEGRVGVCHLDDAQAAQQMNDFIIKCHSEHDMRYSVNSLNFHPMRHNTFAAAASDGAVSFWDKENALRLKVMPRCNQPILCSSFNKDGSIFAYAACADWRRQNENERSIISSPKIFLYTPE